MRRVACCIALLGTWSSVGQVSVALAQAAGGTAKEPMAVPQPGPEMAGIEKLFAHGASWEGQVPAGALGPDAPATASHGKAVCGPIVDGMWCLCEVQDTMGSGGDAKTWQGHMIVGYDLASKSYRAMIADNTGALLAYDARIEGGTLTLETPQAVPMMGHLMKDRLTFVGGPEGTMTSFRDEQQVGDGGWTPFEVVAHVTPIEAGTTR